MHTFGRPFNSITENYYLLRTVAVFLLLMLVGPSYATSQQPDLFILDSMEAEMCMHPILSEYFDKHPERVPESAFLTSLWRGYIATFSVIDGLLNVVNVEAFDGMELSFDDGGDGITEHWRSVIDESFPDPKERVLDWYSGELFVLVVEPPGAGATKKTKYTLLRINIKAGKQNHVEPVWTRYYGETSGISCTAGWEMEVEEGPLTTEWCEVESITSTACVEPDLD